MVDWLVLLIDASESIDAQEYRLQRQGFLEISREHVDFERALWTKMNIEIAGLAPPVEAAGTSRKHPTSERRVRSLELKGREIGRRPCVPGLVNQRRSS